MACRESLPSFEVGGWLKRQRKKSLVSPSGRPLEALALYRARLKAGP